MYQKPESVPNNIDYKTLETFLRLLDPDAQQWSFQVIPEGTGRRGKPVEFHATLQDGAIKLRRHNEDSCGVFVTVNRTDLKGRKRANMAGVRAVWADCDKPNTPEKPWPLEPSMIVETSPGKRHFYWLLSDVMPFDVAEAVLSNIVEGYGADKGAKGLNRVMRLPGFMHRKGDPRRVELVEAKGERYSCEQIEAAFGNRSGVAQVSGTAVSAEEEATIRGYLASIPPDIEEPEWFEVRAGLHHRFGGSEQGYAVFDDWSRGGGAKYKGPAETRAKWKGTGKPKSGPPLTIARVRDIARKYRGEKNGRVDWPMRRGETPVVNAPQNFQALLKHLGIALYHDT